MHWRSRGRRTDSEGQHAEQKLRLSQEGGEVETFEPLRNAECGNLERRQASPWGIQSKSFLLACLHSETMVNSSILQDVLILMKRQTVHRCVCSDVIDDTITTATARASMYHFTKCQTYNHFRRPIGCIIRSRSGRESNGRIIPARTRRTRPKFGLVSCSP